MLRNLDGLEVLGAEVRRMKDGRKRQAIGPSGAGRGVEAT